MDYLNKSEIPKAYSLALGRIRKWERYEQIDSSNYLSGIARGLEKALNEMVLFKTPYSFPFLRGDDFSDTPQCSPKNSRAAIYYRKGISILSIPVWNGSDLKSRAGFLIHVALRYYQIAAGRNGTNRALQRMTEKILTTDPNPGETLGQSEFFDFAAKSELATSLCHELSKLDLQIGSIDPALQRSFSDDLKTSCGRDSSLTVSKTKNLASHLISYLHCAAEIGGLDKVHRISELLNDVMSIQQAMVTANALQIINNMYVLPYGFRKSFESYDFYRRHKNDIFAFLRLTPNEIENAKRFREQWQFELKTIGVQPPR